MNRDQENTNDQQDCYFISFNVVDCIDIFVRPAYKKVVSAALNEYIVDKGLVVHAWCLMSSHLHLVAQVKHGHHFSVVIRHLKRDIAHKVMELVKEEPDLRKEWMLHRFENSSQSLKRIEKLQLWQDCNHPVHIKTGDHNAMLQHIIFIHENPVRDRIVEYPEEYLFSSARDYAGMKGLVYVHKIQLLPGDTLKMLSPRYLQPESMN